MKLFNQFRKYHLMDKAGEGEGGAVELLNLKKAMRVTRSLYPKNISTDSWLASTSLKAKAKKAKATEVTTMI
jgi:hypothetical protein